jgi:uncharacterized protein
VSLRARQEGLLDAIYAEQPEAGVERRLGLSPGSRLDVYRSNLIFGLAGALASTFELTAALLGEDNFRFLARRYSLGNPLRGRLDDFGATFPAFLREAPELGALPAVPDMARLEWLVDRAFRTEPAPPLQPDALGTIVAQGGEAKLELQPSLRLLSSDRRLYGAWSAWRRGGVQAIAADALTEGREELAVWNAEGQVVVALLSPAIGALLRGLDARRSLGDIAAGPPFVEQPDGFAEALRAAWLEGWLAAPRA